MVKQLLLWDEVNYFSPYWEWEDYKAGMYKATKPELFDESVSKAVAILGDQDRCREAMLQVVECWPVACNQNLHDPLVNRRPWRGRACCCVAAGCKEDAVRVAWWMLTESQRDTANAIADEVIQLWEREHA